MPRRPAQSYRSQVVAYLARQLPFVPPERRIEQVRRAEQLHDQVDDQATYPAAFILYRLTGYRPENDSSELVIGGDLAVDLRLLIDTLSRSVNIPVDPHDPTFSPQELALHLHVSTKSLLRWRNLGLRWRWVCLQEGQSPVLTYPQRAVDLLIQRHPQRISRAAQFSHIDSATRQAILRRAKRLAQVKEVNLNQVALHLARRYHRAHETIRQLLQNHDRLHPKDPIFKDRTGPLNGQQKRVIARAYRMGIAASKLCRRFHRTRSTILRAVYEQRVQVLDQRVIDCQMLPTFERPDADQVYLRPLEPLPTHAGLHPQPSLADLPLEWRSIYDKPLPEDEAVVIRLVRMNYLKYKAKTLQSNLRQSRWPRMMDLNLADQCLEDASALRQEIFHAALPWVLIAARRHAVSQSTDPHMEPHLALLPALLEQGHQVLLDAIEHFDPASSRSFETYLNWNLMRRFASLNPLNWASKAHRRLSPQQVLDRFKEQAQQTGISW